jgi:hypothetical protein
MIRVGSNFHDRPGVAELVSLVEPTVEYESGFDGQFFFYLAFDPLLRTEAVVRSLDSPRLRARRIGLPWVERLLGPGRRRIPTGLVRTQLLSMIALVAVFQVGARRRHLAPALVVGLPLCLPILVSLEFMTCELLAAALVLAGLGAAGARRPIASWLCLAVACLTKEVCAIAPVALAARAMLDRRPGLAAARLSALAPLIGWMIYLQSRLPAEPAGMPSLTNFTWPFRGMFAAIVGHGGRVFVGEEIAKNAVRLLGVLWYLGGCGLAAALLRSRRDATSVTAAGAALMAIALNHGPIVPAYDFIFNYARQLFLLPVALWAALALAPEAPRGRVEGWIERWMFAGAAIGAAWIALTLDGKSP